MKKYDKIILECYNRLYKLSEPSVDFNSLLENASTNQYGQKVIDYDSYQISVNVYEDVLNQVARKYKLDKLETTKLKNTIALGCSPRFKKVDGKFV